jgi:hypothetical protein
VVACVLDVGVVNNMIDRTCLIINAAVSYKRIYTRRKLSKNVKYIL